MITIKKTNSHTMARAVYVLPRGHGAPRDGAWNPVAGRPRERRLVQNGHLAPRRSEARLARVNERVWALDGLLFALLLRLVVWGAFAVIVGDAVVGFWERGRELLAGLALVFFPVTFVVWPWVHEAFGRPLWIAALAAVVAQALSFTLSGRERFHRRLPMITTYGRGAETRSPTR